MVTAMAEAQYEFRKRMREVHKKNRRVEKKIAENQIEITSEWKIIVPPSNDFLIRCGRDLEDYFFTSMNTELSLSTKYTEDKAIIYSIDSSLEKNGAYRVDVGENRIKLIGKDERAAAQAGYFIEDLMNFEEAPYLELGVQERAPRFRTRMVHSGYQLDVFPNEHLNAIAHQGINTILVYTNGANTDCYGRNDFNDLIDRAADYGIDVYAYSRMLSRKHPSDEGAEEFYDNLYGNLFRKHPKMKGIVFVGESIEFPSHDERTTQRHRYDNIGPDGKHIVRGKPSPGWFPCRDYPEWVSLIKKIIRREQPEADIVFWTYNWGHQPVEDRIYLIDNLPTDISLQATFEMKEANIDRDGVMCYTHDYTLFFIGPGKYFLSEAEAAKRRNMPLYSMTNTGGLTWDVGTVPYEPMPYRWLERFEAVVDANEKYGLCGTMDSHHYGFYPSFISELAKWCFTVPKPNGEEIIDKILIRDWGEENLEAVRKAFRLLSDGLHYTGSLDQYNAMRIGPAYPLVLFNDWDIKIPFGKNTLHGENKICSPNYGAPIHKDGQLEQYQGETRLYEKCYPMFEEGYKILNSIWPTLPENKRDDARRIAGIAEFMGRAVLTNYHVRIWYLHKIGLALGEPADFERHLSEIERIGKAELENAKSALPVVDFDSRLGYEPTMEYMGDREAIEWKIDILERVLRDDVAKLRHDGCVKDPKPKDLPRQWYE